MNEDDGRPATRGELMATRAELKKDIGDLRTELVGAIDHVVVTLGGRIDQLRADLGAQLRADLGAQLRADLGAQLRADMATMQSALSLELAGHVRAAAEENRQFLAVLDDRYRDLPPRVTMLEHELDLHRRDATLHPRRRRK